MKTPKKMKPEKIIKKLKNTFEKIQKNVFKTRPWAPAILTPRSAAMFLTIRKISALPRLFSNFFILFRKNSSAPKVVSNDLDYSIFFRFTFFENLYLKIFELLF